MRKLAWVCDCCGFEKRDDDDDTVESTFSGWAVIHKYENGECITVDLCPECSEKIKIDNGNN
jgi:hypothetical protein